MLSLSEIRLKALQMVSELHPLNLLVCIMKTPKIRAPNPTLFKKASISFITYTPKLL